MIIFDEIKNMLEINITETIFDKQLLLYSNSALDYLKHNKIPVVNITKSTSQEEFLADGLLASDINIVLSYLHLYVLQRFDRTLMQTSQNATLSWIDKELTSLLYQLKTVYDSEVVTSEN